MFLYGYVIIGMFIGYNANTVLSQFTRSRVAIEKSVSWNGAPWWNYICYIKTIISIKYVKV